MSALRDVFSRSGRRLGAVRLSTGAVVEVASYTIVALTMLWPLSLSLGSKVAGWRDARYYTWAMWRTGELLGSGDPTIRIRDIVWPYGIDLRLIDGHLPTLIGGVWNVVASPLLAQNLALLTGTALNLWAGRRLGKACSEDRLVWALTAIAFATAPAIAARLEVHITMYYAFPAALLIEEAVHVLHRERAVSWVRLGILLFVAFLCGIYLLVFGAIAFGLIVVLGSRPDRLASVVVRSAAGFGVAVLLMTPFLLARLQIDRAESRVGRSLVPIGNTLRAEADALSIVAQPSTATFDLPGMERLRRQFRAGLVHESTVFPGFLLLGGLAGLLFLRSALRWPLLFTSLILWALALGTSVKLDGRFLVQSGSSQPVIFMPYAALLHVPGLASLRSPNRVGFTVTAVLAAGTALSLAWLFSRFRGRLRRTAMAAAAGCLMLPNLMIPIHGNGLASPELERALITVAERGRPGEAMIDVPADCRGQTHDVVFQVLHRTPMVGCQTSTAVIPWRSGLALYGRSAAYAALRCDPSRIGKKPTPFTQKERFDRSDVVALQEEMGVRFYLIDLRAAGRCPRLREALATLRSLPVIGGGRRYIVVDAGSVADPTDPGQASAP